MGPRQSLARDIALALAFKATALTLLYVVAFAAPPQLSAAALAAHLVGAAAPAAGR